MPDDQTHRQMEARGKTKVWGKIAVAAAVVGLISLVVLSFLIYIGGNQRSAALRDLAGSYEKVLDDKRAICDDERTDDQNIPQCQESDPSAQKIVDGNRPIISLPGQDGVNGLPGSPGRNGRDGTDGQPGATGLPGADSTVPGPVGGDGTDGADGQPGADGSNGQDSTVPGPQGPQGEPGSNGTDGKDGAPGESAYPFTFTFTIPGSGLEGDRTVTCTVASSTEQTCSTTEGGTDE